MSRSAWIEDRGDRTGRRWRARYRGLDGRVRSRSFNRKLDAQRWLDDQVQAVSRGTWIDPARSQITLAVWAPRWLGTKRNVRPKTLEGYRSLLRSRVLPAFGSTPLAGIDRPAILQWVATMDDEGLSPDRIRQARQVLSAMLREAVHSRYLASNPAERIPVPTSRLVEPRFLTAIEVEQLATAIADPFGVWVHLMAYGGLRFSESVALRRSRCELLRNRIIVDQAATEVSGRLVFGPTKNRRTRIVVLPRFLTEDLAAHLASDAAEPGPDGLVFQSPRGGPLRYRSFHRHIWPAALNAAGLESLRIHDLRHTAASLLIAEGAGPKQVQEHLGHSTIAITLDRYTHLFPSDTEALALRMDAMREAALSFSRAPSAPRAVHELNPDDRR